MPRINSDFNKRLGAAVRARRVLCGLSQAELGKAIGTSFQMIQKYEKAINRISAEGLVVIAKALKTAPHELIEEAAATDAPISEPVSRINLMAMRGLSRMPDKAQRIALDVINALAGEEAA